MATVHERRQSATQTSLQFSLRHSMVPELSTRRSLSKASPPKLASPLELQPKSTFPSSGMEPGITTTTSTSTKPKRNSAPPCSLDLIASKSDFTVSPVSIDAPASDPLPAAPAPVPAHHPKSALSASLATSGNTGGAEHQGRGLEGLGTKHIPAAGKVCLQSESQTSAPWDTPAESRSPSPSSRDDLSSGGDEEDNSTKASSVTSIGSSKPDGAKNPPISNGSPPDHPKLTRINTAGKRFRRFSLRSKSTPTSDAPPMPELPKISPPPPPPVFKKVKDEMYEAYKMLESDYTKYASKSTGPQKAVAIRQSLLPFLRKFNGKTSNNISPDVLEKRTRTLYRWWTGLMAQLRNRNTQTISGADRPAYYEAVSLIMSRPEWRSCPSSFAPLSEKFDAGSVSSASLASTSSAFSLAKSVQHNIEVLFTRTLYDTFAYVVEKMALRASPPGLVAFAGKVVAYAFYFCQGVAEMLIGLWQLDPATVRRVLPEFGLGRATDLRHVSDDILTNFPETLYPLGFTTMAALIRQMKKPPKPPIGIPVDWNGPWTSRWSGRDSDLLPVFLKEYHFLTCEFLPPDATLAARICAPGYVPILAQMLSMVDNYIHRSMAAEDSTTTSTTFEDLLNSTTALALSVRDTSARTADNKLVVLLQDILSDRLCSQTCKDVYTTSLVAVIRAAVQRTRLYDSAACFQLCDLIEELLPILSRAGRQETGDYIDWKFWLQVAQTMLQSENNMTELRVISFIYATWDLLVATEERKRAVCLEWLLSEPIWVRFFCHWCPMVRAYYMRLLCWRLGRFNGDANELDCEIFKIMLLRLRTGHTYHVTMCRDFAAFGGKPSSTAPCLPAPCRRLVILRNDTLTMAQGALLDGIIPNSIPFVPTPGSLLRTQSAKPVSSLEESDGESEGSNESPKSDDTAIFHKWTLRSMFGFKAASPPPSPRNWVPSPVAEKIRPKVQANFKFSLEYIDRPVFGRDRILGLSRLPSPAQRYLDNIGVEIPTIEVLSGTVTAKHWTYVGRALAEWVLVIVEYESFFDRRKNEGRESDKDVETPSLTVDSMRKF